MNLLKYRQYNGFWVPPEIVSYPADRREQIGTLFLKDNLTRFIKDLENIILYNNSTSRDLYLGITV